MYTGILYRKTIEQLEEAPTILRLVAMKTIAGQLWVAFVGFKNGNDGGMKMQWV